MLQKYRIAYFNVFPKQNVRLHFVDGSSDGPELAVPSRLPLPAVWFCRFYGKEVLSLFLLRESGLALSLALTWRMWRAWWCVTSEAIQLCFSPFGNIATIMWELLAQFSLWQKGPGILCPSPSQPPANIPAHCTSINKTRWNPLIPPANPWSQEK